MSTGRDLVEGIDLGKKVNSESKNTTTSTVLQSLTPTSRTYSYTDYLTGNLNSHIPHVDGDDPSGQFIWAFRHGGFNRVLDKCAVKATQSKGAAQAWALTTPIVYLTSPALLWQMSFQIDNLKNAEATGVQKKFIGTKTAATLDSRTPEYKKSRGHLTHRVFAPIQKLPLPMRTTMQAYLNEIEDAARTQQSLDLGNLAARIAISMISMQIGIVHFSEEDKTAIANIVTNVMTSISKMGYITRLAFEDKISDTMKWGVNHLFCLKKSTIAKLEDAIDRVNPSLTPQLDQEVKKGEALISKLIENNKTEILKSLKSFEDTKESKESDLFSREMLDNIKLFIIGGFETTTKFITFCMLMLADPKNQSFVQALRDELAKLTKPLKDLVHEDIQNLKYLRAFALEVLRLFPSFSHVRWKAIKDFTLNQTLKIPSNKAEYVKLPLAKKKKFYEDELSKCEKKDDIAIPAGSMIVTSPFYAHRSEEAYKNAHEFNPNRWLENDLADFNLETFTLMNNSFFHTFGSDLRMCPGRKFSELEGMLFIANIAANFDLTVDKKFHFQSHPENISTILDIGFPLEFMPKIKVTGNFSPVQRLQLNEQASITPAS